MARGKTIAQRGDKRKHMDETQFHSIQHFEQYNQHFEKAPIIQERFVDLVDLKDYFIPSYFAKRGWEKLLGDLPRVCEPLIREFYANAILRNDYIDCWIRDNEFTLEVGDIDGVLGHGDLHHKDFTPFKDRMLSIETVQSRIGGAREGKCLNITTFPPDLRCLTYIMLFNLYLVRKMTTINNARAISLMELRERTYINIGAHVFSIIAKETRTTSKPELVLPSIIIRILHEKGVETPQDISLMSVPSVINSQTIIRSRVRLSGDAEVEDPEQEHPMDTKTEAEGQPSSS